MARKGGVRILLVVAAGFPLLLAGGAALLTAVIGQSCSTAGVGDAPSRVAVRDIPANVLRIYERVGAQYKLPWEILAGIGQEECDQGRLPDPSCTPQPGATGPGVANSAGASGPMQIGVGGAAGDAYDPLRHYLPEPSLGPHDPMTAVELAALVLIKDKGAPTGQPIDAYASSVAAYNGSGSIADAYAARVLADAHAYQGAGAADVGAGCPAAAFGTPLVAGTRAKIIAATGEAEAPAGAPVAVQDMIAAGNRIDHFDYQWGGGHANLAQSDSATDPQPQGGIGPGDNGTPGYDCSGATAYVLFGGGLGAYFGGPGGAVPSSGSFGSFGVPGPGRWVTWYYTAGHVYIEVAGIYFDTDAGNGNRPNPPATGPRWSYVGTGPAGFAERHPPGL